MIILQNHRSMKKPFLLIVILTLTLSPFFLHAQAIGWQKLNGPFGGGGKVGEGKDGYLVLRTGDEVIYRSEDGQFWEKMPAPPGTKFNPPMVVSADGNLYTGEGNKIYRSTDNGLSWSLLVIDQPHIATFALPGGELLTATSNDQIKRSDDDGQTWEIVATGVEDMIGFQYNPFTGDVYTWNSYVASGSTGKLWRSSDQGQTWAVVLEEEELEQGEVVFSPNGGIFVSIRNFIIRSMDNGATWTYLEGLTQNSSYDVSLGISVTGRLFAQEWSHCGYSDDNGDTWHPLADETGNQLLNFSNGDNGKIFAHRYGGSLYVSEDNGASWNFAAYNLLNAGIIRVAHLDESRLLTLTRDGLFYTPDAGNSWQLIWDKVICNNTFNDEFALAVSTDGSWYLWDGNEQIIRFTNEGQTHEILNTPAPVDEFHYRGMWSSPAAPVIFLRISNGFYKSEDGGQHWTLQTNNFSTANLVMLNDGVLLSFKTEGVFRSDDLGETWAHIFSRDFWGANVFVAPDGRIYSIDSDRILAISSDGGYSWQEIQRNSNKYWQDVSVNNLGHIFLYEEFDNSVVRSVDGGLTFNSIGNPDDDGRSSWGIPVTIGPSQHLYLKQEVDGIYRSLQPTSAAKLITGKAWHDLDLDCAYVEPDSLMPGRLVKLTGDNETLYGYSNAQGRYRAPVVSGEYQLSVVPPSDYWLSCDASVVIPDNSTAGIVDSVDIGIQVITACPLATVSVSAPFLRRCFESTLYVHYENTGTLPALNASVTLTLDDLLQFVGASLPVASQNGQEFTFLLGDLAVGASGSMTLTVIPSCTAELGYVHCISAHIYPDELCPELNTPHIVTDAVCLGDSIQLIINNTGTANMSAPLGWFVIASDAPSGTFPNAIAAGDFLLDAGASFTTTIAADYEKLTFFARQAPEYPFNVTSTTTIQGCGTGQLPLLIFSEDDAGPFTDVLCRHTIGSFDPNDKQGFPKGLTNNGYIEQDQVLTYLVRFQNTGTDTAFNVSILDALPATLDPATVRLLNASHACELRVQPNGALLFVFEQIMLPHSGVNEAASHGFVQFSVEQQPDIPVGTTIRNRAGIYFDFNAPIMTNQTLHTVGIPDITTDTKETTLEPAALHANPNPFEEVFSVTLAANVPIQGLRLVLLDSNGRVVREKAFESNSVSIPQGNLPKGVYHFMVVNASGRRIGSGTVVAH